MSKADELKKNFLKSIMDLRNKGLVEQDSLLDVFEDVIEPFIAELEQQIEKLKTDIYNAIESASKWYVQDPVYSMLVDIYNDNFEITKGVSN